MFSEDVTRATFDEEPLAGLWTSDDIVGIYDRLIAMGDTDPGLVSPRMMAYYQQRKNYYQTIANDERLNRRRHVEELKALDDPNLHHRLEVARDGRVIEGARKFGR